MVLSQWRSLPFAQLFKAEHHPWLLFPPFSHSINFQVLSSSLPIPFMISLPHHAVLPVQNWFTAKARVIQLFSPLYSRVAVLEFKSDHVTPLLKNSSMLLYKRSVNLPKDSKTTSFPLFTISFTLIVPHNHSALQPNETYWMSSNIQCSFLFLRILFSLLFHALKIS